MLLDPLRSLGTLLRDLSGPPGDHLRAELARWPGRGLEAVYVDPLPSGLLVLALPRETSPAEAPYAASLVWCFADAEGAHVRYLSLKRLVSVTREERTGETRLTLHFDPPVTAVALSAQGEVLRGYAELVATRLQGWLAVGVW